MFRKGIPLIVLLIAFVFILGCDPAGQTTTSTNIPISTTLTTIITTENTVTTDVSTTAVLTTPTTTTAPATTALTTAAQTTAALTTVAPTTAVPTTLAPTTTEPITTETEPSTLFEPGYLGSLSLPVIDEAEPNTFAGLYIDNIERNNDTFGGGTDCEVMLSFPSSFELGAINVTLQYYDVGTSSWLNYGSGIDYTTEYNNFVLTNPGIVQLRLKVYGGDMDGYVSNTVTTAHTNINTYFSSWGLDESMWITGIMTPYVGHGLEAFFNVKTLDMQENVIGGLTYQWFRINPNTFEHTPIPDATSLTYTTTTDDVGYFIGIIATGDEETVGGRIEIISNYEPVLLTAEMYATNASNTGFDIHFDHLVDGLNPDGFMISDSEYNEIEVVSITQGATAASYHVTIAAPVNNQALYVSYSDVCWIGITYFEEMHMTRQLVIELEP
ncbi:MAG: hypothetical protein WC339_06295 [Candidatus Izemoplasmatales bacterium]|jgi:hypothetical protein|nr:hypothetical protein [Candidatus Izemoplasmatales bacterium]